MILGKKVRLRSLEREDLPRCVAWINDPEVQAGIAMYLPVSMDEEEKWFEGMKQNDPHERSLAIDANTEDGWRHIGTTGFHHISWRDGHADFGIMIGDKAYWNKGWGTDAVQTLVRFGFVDLNLIRIWLRVFDYNERAKRCYEKVGFAVEGRLRQHHFHAGQHYDELIMGLLREEWSKQHDE